MERLLFLDNTEAAQRTCQGSLAGLMSEDSAYTWVQQAVELYYRRYNYTPLELQFSTYKKLQVLPLFLQSSDCLSSSTMHAMMIVVWTLIGLKLLFVLIGCCIMCYDAYESFSRRRSSRAGQAGGLFRRTRDSSGASGGCSRLRSLEPVYLDGEQPTAILVDGDQLKALDQPEALGASQ